jgi:amidase
LRQHWTVSIQDPHPMSSYLASSSATDLVNALAAGSLTSVELTQALIARISAIDAPTSEIALRSVIAVHGAALQRAEQCDREREAGLPRGPLHGIPVLIKDNIEVIGLPGTAGSLALTKCAVTRDADLVVRLKDAGAIVLGSTNLSEWANVRSPRSTSGWSAVGGLTGNPWSLDRSAGGSSSGSGAAIAAGLAPLAVGTETNGSITCPAALNGVVGLKPTVGNVSTRGVVPISANQDSPGPLARTVRDAALLYEVLSGTSGALAACAPDAARSLHIGVAEGWLTSDAATDAVFANAVSLLTPFVGRVSTANVPAADDTVATDQTTSLLAELFDDLAAYFTLREGSPVKTVDELIAFNCANAKDELAAFGQEYLEQSVAIGGRAGDRYIGARQRNVDWATNEVFAPAWDAGFDVLVAPAYRPAWKSDLTHGDILMGGGAVTTPAAILGLPTLTVPMGFVNGLPVGLSIVGRAGSETTLLAVGYALEGALGLLASGALRPTWTKPWRG